MRTLLLLGCAGLLAGCAGRGTDPAARSATPAPGPGTRTNAVPEATVIFPLTGRVAFVNPDLRFVVLDFSLGRMPAVETKLSVYRDGKKIGAVRVSGPQRENHIAADLIDGGVQAGDDVRAD